MGKTKRGKDRPKLGRIAASRLLISDSRLQTTYEVRIGVPEPDRSGDWRCAYHIRGIGMRSPRYAFGVDSVQTLIQVLSAVRSDLEAAGTKAHWVGGEPGDPGFPHFIPLAFGLGFSRRIKRMIDLEVTRHSKKLEANARQGRQSRKT